MEQVACVCCWFCVSARRRAFPGWLDRGLEDESIHLGYGVCGLWPVPALEGLWPTLGGLWHVACGLWPVDIRGLMRREDWDFWAGVWGAGRKEGRKNRRYGHETFFFECWCRILGGCSGYSSWPHGMLKLNQ